MSMQDFEFPHGMRGGHDDPVYPLSEACGLLSVLAAALEDGRTLENDGRSSEVMARSSNIMTAAIDGISTLVALGAFLANEEAVKAAKAGVS